LVDGGGNPSIIHGLVSSVTAPNGVTTANYDYIGVNTSSIFTAEANSINTAGPLAIGACSLGLPMVITTETGSLTDVVCGAIFALSMDAGSTGGTITQATGGRSTAIPNGITNIDRHYGWYADCPFGTIATDNWGIYSKDAEKNYFEGAVVVGVSDVPTNSSVGIELNSTTKAVLLPRMTETERNSLTAVAGMMIYNTDANVFQGYNGSLWKDFH
jgi:hypothetical protein